MKEFPSEKRVFTMEAIYRVGMFHLFPSAAADWNVLLFSNQHVTSNSSSADISNARAQALRSAKTSLEKQLEQ